MWNWLTLVLCVRVCALKITGSVLRFSTHFRRQTARFCLFKSFRTTCPWANRSVHATGGSKQVQMSPFTRASSVCERAGNQNTCFQVQQHWQRELERVCGVTKTLSVSHCTVYLYVLYCEWLKDIVRWMLETPLDMTPLKTALRALLL